MSIKKTIEPSDLQGENIVPIFQNKNNELKGVDQRNYSAINRLGSYATRDFDKLYGKYGVADRGWSQEDWDEIRGNNQGFFEKAGHGVGKFALNTGLNVGGAFATLGFGIVKAMFDQKLSSVWDNEVGYAIDNATEKVSEWMPHYYTKAQQEGSFWERVLNQNFVFDQMGQAASFIAGAVITETLSAGMATAVVGNMAVRTALGINKAKRMLTFGNKLTNTSKAKDVANLRNIVGAKNKLKVTGDLFRQVGTGAVWEGSVETRGFVKLAEEEFLERYREQHGQDPSFDEIAEYRSKIMGVANGVFAANVAIVSVGNAITLGKTFGPKSWGIGAKVTGKAPRSIKQAMVDGAKVYSEAFKSYSGLRKSMIYTWNATKKPIFEAGEETGQGVAVNAGLEYLFNREHLGYTSNSINFIRSVMKGTGDQVTSTEGQVEAFIGALMGGMGFVHFKRNKATGKLGVSWQGGSIGAVRDLNRDREETQKIADEYTQISLQHENAVGIIRSLNALTAYSDKSNSAYQSGDNIESTLADKKAFFEYVNMRKNMGMESTLKNETAEHIANMSNEDYAENFNLDKNLDNAAIEKHKTEAVKEYKSLVDKANAALKSAQHLASTMNISEDRMDEVNAFAMTLFEADVIDQMETTVANDISMITGLSPDVIKNNERAKEEFEKHKARFKKIDSLIKRRESLLEKLNKPLNLDKSDNSAFELINNQLTQIEEQKAKLKKELVDLGYKGNPNDIENAYKEYLENETKLSPTNISPTQSEELKSHLTDLFEISNRRVANLNAYQKLRDFKALAEFKSSIAEINDRLVEKGLLEEDTTVADDSLEESDPVERNAEENLNKPETESKELVDRKVKNINSINNSIKESSIEVSNGDPTGETISSRVYNYLGKAYGYVNSWFPSSQDEISETEASKLIGLKDPKIENLSANKFNVNSIKDFLLAFKHPNNGVNQALKKAGFVKFITNVKAVSNNSITDNQEIKTDATLIPVIGIKSDGSVFMIHTNTLFNDIDPNIANEKLFFKARIKQELFEETYNIDIDGHIKIDIEAVRNVDSLESVDSESVTVSGFNPVARNSEEMKEMFNIIMDRPEKSQMNRGHFSMINNFNLKEEWKRDMQDNLASLSKDELQKSHRIVVTPPTEANDDNLIELDAPNNLHYKANKFSVKFFVGEKQVGALKDPRRMFNSEGEPITFKNSKELSKYVSEENATRGEVEAMFAEYEDMVELFNKLEVIYDENNGTDIDVNLNEIGLDASFRITISQIPYSATEERPILLDSKENAIEYDGEKFFIIYDRKDLEDGGISENINVFNAETGELIQSTPISASEDYFVKMYNSSERKDKFFNRYQVITPTANGTIMTPLSLKRADEDDKQVFLSAFNEAITTITADNRKDNQEGALLEKRLNREFFINLKLDEGLKNAQTETKFVTYEENDKTHLKLIVQLIKRGEKPTTVANARFDLTDINPFESYDDLINELNKRLSEGEDIRYVTDYQITNINISEDTYPPSKLEPNIKMNKHNAYMTLNKTKEAISKEKVKKAVKKVDNEELPVAQTLGSSKKKAAKVTNVNTETVEKIEADREYQLDKLFETIGIPHTQKNLEIIAERGDKKAIAFIEEYDTIITKYDAQLKALKQAETKATPTESQQSEKENTELKKKEAKLEELVLKNKDLKDRGLKIELLKEIDALKKEIILIKNNTKASDSGVFGPTGMISNERDVESFEQGSYILSKTLGIEPKSVETIFSKLGKISGLKGAFYNGAIYLAKKMPKGTAYHEAFHYVFRTLLDNNQIGYLLEYAKGRYDAPTTIEIDQLRKVSDRYNKATENELIDLFFEEKLSEEFRAYANRKGISKPRTFAEKIFKFIKDFINKFRNNKTEIQSLFDEILIGGFKSKKPKYNIFTSKSILAPLTINKIGSFEDNTFSNKFSTDESELFSNLILAGSLEIINSKDVELFKNEKLSVLIEYALSELASKYDISDNESLMNKIAMIDNDTEQMRAMDYYNTMYLSLSDASNSVALKEDVANKLKFFNIDSDSLELSIENNEDGINRFDLGPDNISGFYNMSKKMKVFMATVSYDVENEFGIDETKVVSAYKLYDSLTRGLANKPKESIWKAAKIISKYNVEAAMFMTKFTKESGIKENESDNHFNSNYQLFLNTFSNARVSHIQTLNNIANNKYGENKVFNANTKDADVQQIKKWYKNHEFFKKRSIGSVISSIQEANVAVSLNGLNFAKNKEFGFKFNAKVKQLISSMANIGIEISQGYAELSVAKANEGALDKFTTKKADDAREILSMYPDVNAFDANSAEQIKNLLEAGEDIFSKAENTGAYTRLKDIANANAIFDTSMISTTFRNESNKLVTDIIKHNFLTEKWIDIRHNLNKYKDALVSLEAFKAAFPNIPVHNVRFIYNALKDNLLLNHDSASIIFRGDNNLKIVGSTRQTILVGEEQIEFSDTQSKEGESFGDMDTRGKLHTMLSLFAKKSNKYLSRGKKSNQEEHEFATYIAYVNETKNTTYAIDLPVNNFISKDNYQKALYSLFKGELNRIKEEIRLKDSLGSKENPRIDNYNYSEIDNANLRAQDFFLFKDWLLKLDKGLYDEIKLNPDLFDSDIAPERLQAFFDKLVNDRVSALKEFMEEDYIMLEEFIPDHFNKENQDELFMDFWVNDFVNRVEFNKLLNIDLAVSHKDAVDVIKRASSVSANGNNFSLNGKDKSRGVALEIEEVEREIETKEGFETVKIDSADAQSWQSTFWKFLKIISEGKLSDKIEDIYYKLLSGERLSDEESIYAMDQGVSFNPDKDVFNDETTKIKTSMFTLSRQITSDPVNNNSIKETKEYYKELVLSYKEYLKDNITYNELVENAKVIGTNISKLWKAKEGFGKLHDMLQDMDSQFIQYVSATSAHKGAIKNKQKDGSIIGEDNIFEHENKNWRRQQETTGFKNELTHGTQLTTLVWSEHEKEAISYFSANGKVHEVKTVEYAEAYKKFLGERVSQSFQEKKKQIVDELGKPKLKELYESFKASLDASGSNPFINEMFELQGPNPSYNLNTPAIVNKFEAMFLSYISKGVFSQKVSGTKFTLVSGYGFRNLRHMVKDDKISGVFYSEVIVSDYLKFKFGLKSNDRIPDEVLDMLGIRIPTQDKHSMIILRVSGETLPAIYGNAIIAPAEIVYLSGADFDIDSLYVSSKATFFKGRSFGSYWKKDDPIKHAFHEHLYSTLRKSDKNAFNDVMSQMNNVSDDSVGSQLDVETHEGLSILLAKFKEQEKATNIEDNDENIYNKLKADFIKKHESTIKSNVAAYKKGELQNIVPLSKEEMNNLLLDLEMRLVHTNDNMDIAGTPANTEAIDAAVKFLYKENDKVDNTKLSNPYDSIDMMRSYKANDDGKKGIGPAANFNKLFQYLVANLTQVNSAIKYKVGETIHEYNAFNSLVEGGTIVDNKKIGGNRINDIISAFVSMATDNAKDPKAGKLNLTQQSLGTALTLIGMQMPYKDAIILMSNPYIVKINNIFSLSRSVINTSRERGNTFDNIYKEIHDELSNRKIVIEQLLSDRKIKYSDKKPILDFELLSTAVLTKADYSKYNERTFDGMSDSKLAESGKRYLSYLNTNLSSIEMYKEAKVISDSLMNVTKLSSLDKGLDASFSDLEGIEYALKELGLNFNKSTKTLNNIVDSEGKNVFKLFDSKKLIDNSPLIRENIKNFFETREISRIFAIYETPVFRIIKNAVMGSMKSNLINKSDSVAKINRDLLSYVGVKHLLENFKVKGYSLIDEINNIYKDNKIAFSDDIRSILYSENIEVEGGLVANPYKGNLFLKYLEINEISGIEVLESNTWTQQNDKFVGDLVTGFEQLMGNKKALKFESNGVVSEVVPNDLIRKIHAYLIVKDSMQYRSNSLLQQVSPKIYKWMSNSMDEVLRIFNSDESNTEIKKYFGDGFSRNQLIIDFAFRYGTQPGVQFDIKYTKDTTLTKGQLPGMLRIDSQNETLTIDPNNMGDVSNEVRKVNRGKRFKALMESGLFKAGEGENEFLIGYPLLFKMNKVTYRLDQSFIQPKNGDKYEVALAEKLGEDGFVYASSVVYTKSPISRNNIFKPFGFQTLKQQDEFINKINSLSPRVASSKDEVTTTEFSDFEDDSFDESAIEANSALLMTNLANKFKSTTQQPTSVKEGVDSTHPSLNKLNLENLNKIEPCS